MERLYFIGTLVLVLDLFYFIEILALILDMQDLFCFVEIRSLILYRLGLICFVEIRALIMDQLSFEFIEVLALVQNLLFPLNLLTATVFLLWVRPE